MKDIKNTSVEEFLVNISKICGSFGNCNGCPLRPYYESGFCSCISDLPNIFHTVKKHMESIEKDRLEDLLIKCFEWSINVGGQHTKDLIRATGITGEELEEIGYPKDEFPELFEGIGE